MLLLGKFWGTFEKIAYLFSEIFYAITYQIMLGNLDNEVYFKKAFTNEIVFKAFVKDVLGIEFELGTIETEKKFSPKIGYIDFELDIYAESKDKRICIEIQRVEYDHHFDRFLHYFFMLIAEQQKSAKEYNIDQTMYMIVILTAPYTISEKNGKAILDEVLLLHLNPQTLGGEMRNSYGHQFVCLNPNHSDSSTPQNIRDWLDLIYQSIHSPQRPVLNTQREGIYKAIELIQFDNLTPEERAEAKNKEAARVTLVKLETKAREEGKQEGITEGMEKGREEERSEIARKLIGLGLDDATIANATDMTLEEIAQIRLRHHQYDKYYPSTESKQHQ